MEFLTVNRDTTVAGLREGCILRVEGNSMKLMGNRPLRVFRFGKDPQEFTKDDNLDFLLKITAG
jgi:dipeptidase E